MLVYSFVHSTEGTSRSLYFSHDSLVPKFYQFIIIFFLFISVGFDFFSSPLQNFLLNDHHFGC